MIVPNTKLSNSEFNKLSNFIYSNYGIKMPLTKKTMLESRLQKRLKALDLLSFGDYCDLIFSKDGQKQELIYMIDEVTTNKTDFFREPAHFDFMTRVALPEITESSTIKKPINIWSAGSSSGEEAYTIAMTIEEYFSLHEIHYNYHILGTDISTQILQKAITAIYPEARIAGIPINIKTKYFLKSKNIIDRTVRVIPDLRKKVSFQRLNFMDPVYEVSQMFDIVFCRNVLIYFDRDTQERVIYNLCKKLRSGGFFFLGHSESITDMNLPLEQIKPTIFRRK